MRVNLFRTSLIFLLGCCVVSALSAQNKKKKPRYERVDRENLVHPVHASIFGSSGTEWLCGGGFKSDQSLVLIGNSVGPSLTVGKVQAKVFGQDRPAPAPMEWPLQMDRKGQPAINKKTGQPKREQWSADLPQATGFIALLDPDWKTVKTLVRFPWGAASIYRGLVAEDGAIYIAGTGDEAFLKSVGSDVSAVPSFEVDYGKSSPRLRTNFVAKIKSSGKSVEWVRFHTAPQSDPDLEILPDGNILFKNLSFDVFSPKGKMVNRVTRDRGMNPKHYSYNYKTKEFAYGHERPWHTGREPWRAPSLNIYDPDGSMKMQLYSMPGPVVGSDASRRVSDSALRLIQYLPDGDLLIHAWSDGGNSIMLNQPYSLHEGAWNNNSGLRMNSAGASVMSFSYLIRIDMETYKVDKGTLWASQHNGVASAVISDFAEASDGSVLFTGRVTGHLSGTPNAFPVEVPVEGGEGYESYTRGKVLGKPPGGSNVTIVNPDFDGLRFSTYIPGSHGLYVGANQARMRSVIQKVGSRELALVVTGVQTDPNIPFLNGAQKGFAGGYLDGHFTIIEMTPAKKRMNPETGLPLSE